mgnify:CR=1 FL=1
MNAANKAWYWLAAGGLALGLNGYYQDGGLQGLHRLVRPGGTITVSTLNRTPKAFLTAIVGAEYLARILPEAEASPPTAQPDAGPTRSEPAQGSTRTAFIRHRRLGHARRTGCR